MRRASRLGGGCGPPSRQPQAPVEALRAASPGTAMLLVRRNELRHPGVPGAACGLELNPANPLRSLALLGGEIAAELSTGFFLLHLVLLLPSLLTFRKQNS